MYCNKISVSLLKIQSLIPLFTSIWIGLGTTATFAQTVPASTRIPIADNTLGTQVTGSNNSIITGGLNRGQNLFHSFQDFSVPTGGSATFINPVGTKAIITRVTGNLFSDIDGIVNSQGANFFLINPNGIVFGANATLNVGQTFVGSTANWIDLTDGGGNNYRFGINGNDAPLLTINQNAVLTPARLILGSGNGEIRTLGSLDNNLGYIGLIGGNVTIDGGSIFALSGRIELGGLSAPGTIELGGDGNNFRVSYPINIARSDVLITNGSSIAAIGLGGGDINIAGRNIQLSNSSTLYGGIISGTGSPTTVAGDINIDGTGQVLLSNSQIYNSVELNSIGTSGNINIQGSSVSFKDGAQISTGTEGKGNAGNIIVTAKETFLLAGTSDSTRFSSGINTSVSKDAEGNAGNIDIRAGSVSLQDGAIFASTTQGKGNSGNITVTATDAVSLSGVNKFFGLPSTISTSTFSVGEGRGGNIDIRAGSVSLQDGTSLSSTTNGNGNAGNIAVTVRDTVSLSGISFPRGYSSSISTNALNGTGNGGDIDIQAASVSLQDGANVSSATNSKGNAGNVTVMAKDTVSLSGFNSIRIVSSSIASNVIESEGNGGRIDIRTGSLLLRDGAQISAITTGKGTAGNISVTAKDLVSISGNFDDYFSTLSVNSSSNTGTAGDIFIASPKIVLENGARMNAQSTNGNGGNINISGISPNAANLLILRGGAKISTTGGTAQQGGNGGNININIPNGFIVTAPNENSDITANAFGGSGGKVTINSQQNFWIAPLSRAELEQRLGTKDPTRLTPGNLSSNNITAISQVNPNLSGQVNITPPGIDITAGLTPLPNNVVDPINRINPNCSAKSIGNNSFTNTGRGGIPASPTDPLNEEKISVNWVKLNPADTIPATPIDDPDIAHLSKPIVEAQGWMRDRNGDIILVAQSRSSISIHPSQPASGCVEK
jgi:filamentous hemagglutinin family protein